jgi:hypothetical protein
MFAHFREVKMDFHKKKITLMLVENFSPLQFFAWS